MDRRQKLSTIKRYNQKQICASRLLKKSLRNSYILKLLSLMFHTLTAPVLVKPKTCSFTDVIPKTMNVIYLSYNKIYTLRFKSHSSTHMGVLFFILANRLMMAALAETRC
jgi:hypothetical protein